MIISFPPQSATKEGIVAVGGDLNPLRILEAYKNGIFPWFSDDENLMWWSQILLIFISRKKLRFQKGLKSFLKRMNIELASMKTLRM